MCDIETINPYEEPLTKYFETIIDFIHTYNRLNKILLKDAQKYSQEGSIYDATSALVISDWTGSTDNGWKINYYTGTIKEVNKKNYPDEISKILSREFGMAYAQCFEAFETLLKDLIYIKIQNDHNFKNLLPNNDYSRQSIKGGTDLFKLVRKAGGERFGKYSKENNCKFRFKEMFTIISEIRHAITHSKGVLATAKIPNDNYYKALFKYLMPFNDLEGEKILLKFEYDMFYNLLIYLSEFGYQIFKILSEEDNYECKIL